VHLVIEETKHNMAIERTL